MWLLLQLQLGVLVLQLCLAAAVACRCLTLCAVLPCSFVGYAGLMDKCALQLCQLLRTKAATGEEVDIWQALGRMTLQVGWGALVWCCSGPVDDAGGKGCDGASCDGPWHGLQPCWPQWSILHCACCTCCMPGTGCLCLTRSCLA